MALLRDWTKKTILGSRVLRFAGGFQGPSAAILMFHSVLRDPAREFDSLGGIVHSEPVFRAQMEMLARNYHPISLDDAIKHLSDGKDLPKRSVVVTFDDGYADNYEVAMPILNRFAVPATFYVPVDCVENKRLPWPSRLRFAFRKTKASQWIDASTKSWSLVASENRESAYLAACDSCCQLSGASQEEFVRCVEQELQTSLSSQLGSPMMSYEIGRASCRE